MVAKVMIRTKPLFLVQTCLASPEQYDCYIGPSPNGLLILPQLDNDAGERSVVGYFRLRWSVFTVVCPDVGGDPVYVDTIDAGGWTGGFDVRDRMRHLRAGLAAVHDWLLRNRPNDYLLGCDILPQ